MTATLATALATFVMLMRLAELGTRTLNNVLDTIRKLRFLLLRRRRRG